MATTLSATLSLAVVGSVVETGTLTDNFERINLANSLSYTDGTGTSQANRWRRLVSSVNAPTTYTLDIFADSFGRQVDFASIKAFVVINTDTTVGENLAVSGSFVTAHLGGPLTIHPSNGYVAMVSPTGYTITQAVTDEVTFSGAPNTVSFEFWVLGNT